MNMDDDIVGYFGGWIDEKKRIGILTAKSYPNIEEQKLTNKQKEKLK